MAWMMGITLPHMKRAVVFLLISLALAAELFAVLRPRFPVKAEPPFRGDLIVWGDEIPQGSLKETAPQRLR
jgi:hypothetical protein